MAKIIDAARIGNAITLRRTPSQQAFVKGTLASTDGYSACVLEPVIRVPWR
jgi:hypothetical protein